MIKVRNLTKKYGNHLAVNGISFDIKPGKIYGLLGPNGAGKSTTMNILTGCLAATSGEVKVDGHDIFDEPIEAKRHIGYLPEQPPVYGEMTPKEYDLFFYMVRNKGLALTRESLISEVWGYDFFGDERTLDTHIKLLRKSLGEYSSCIVTLRGVGYRFETV